MTGRFGVGCERGGGGSEAACRAAKRMAAGMCSGATAALVCNPIELVKTRQQGEQKFGYRGPIDGLRQLYASEGCEPCVTLVMYYNRLAGRALLPVVAGAKAVAGGLEADPRIAVE